MSNPLQHLAHDHRELSGLLLAVHEAFERIERGRSTLDDELHEIRDGIEAFREALLEHFAREQEGLLPFVAARLPSLSARIDTLIAEHDRIAALLTTLVDTLATVDDFQAPSHQREKAAANPASAFVAWRARLRDFEALYAAHTKSEAAFLDEVATALAQDAGATEQLRTLLEEG